MNAGMLAPWLAPTLAHVDGLLDTQRLPHALILHGPEGWGIERLARSIALRVIGRLDFAGEITEFAHPDFRWIVPEGKGEQIKIEAVRSIADYSAQTPQISSRKVIVLLHAEAMNAHAANALLKTLEEPPPGTHVLLVTSLLADLLPTIRSRCQRLDVKAGSPRQALDWVRGQVEIADPKRLELLAFELRFAPEAIAEAIRTGAAPVAAVLREALRRDASIIEISAQATSFGADEFVARAMCHLMGALALRHERTAMIGPLATQLRGVSAGRIHALWDAHVAARALLRSTGNPNAKLVLENLLLGWRGLAA